MTTPFTPSDDLVWQVAGKLDEVFFECSHLRGTEWRARARNVLTAIAPAIIDEGIRQRVEAIPFFECPPCLDGVSREDLLAALGVPPTEEEGR